MKILKSFIVILFLVQSSQVMAFDLKGKLKDITGQKDSASGEFDLKGGKTQLMDAFFESSQNYLKALEYLLEAYGLNVQAAQVKATIDNYGKNNEWNGIPNVLNNLVFGNGNVPEGTYFYVITYGGEYEDKKPTRGFVYLRNK